METGGSSQVGELRCLMSISCLVTLDPLGQTGQLQEAGCWDRAGADVLEAM